MASVGDAGLARITLVAPRTRIDLALPTDVPLADLLPTLLHVTGNDFAGEGASGGAWALSRLGGAALDSSRTPAQLQVHDGELLYLRPRGEEAPMLVFDDVVDAVATATGDRTGRWRPATTRLFGLGLGIAALVAGAIALPFSAPPHSVAAVIALSVALALLGVAVVLSRALGDSRAGVAFAATAAVYAASGGLLVMLGDRPLSALSPADLLITVTIVLLVTVIGAIGVADAAPLFLGIAIISVAVGLTVALVLAFHGSLAATGAIVATVAFGAMPALPMLAYRSAGLPIPTVPVEAEELKRDNESVDGARVLQRSVRADGLLTAMLAGLSVIGATAALMAADMGTAGMLFSLTLGLILLARARFFGSRAQRLWLLCCGSIAVASASFTFFTLIEYPLRLVVILGVVLTVAAISVSFGLAGVGTDRKQSPVWGRILDILEVILILGLVPMAVWVSGLYAWIRAIRG